MKRQITQILEELEKKSQLEKSRRINIERQDRMLAITWDTGLFYSALISATKAKSVLELGTSTGYSTLWIARALLANHQNPKILTVEANPAKIVRARQNFENAGVSKFVKIIPTRILDALKKLPRKPMFDFVLIDADKENAKNYFELVLPRVRTGGIIATDNMLYPKKYRKIMSRYSRYIAKKKNAWTVTLPIGNGQEVTIKTR